MNKYSFPRFALLLLIGCWIAGGGQALAVEYQTLNAGWLLETARNTVLTSEPWQSAGCTVDITGTPSDITVYREGHIEVIGSLERVPGGLRDLGAVTVEVYVGGELYLRFDPSPYLAVSMTTFMTSRDIDRGEILTEDDVEETAVEVRSLPTGELFESLDEIVGMAARTNLQVGRILRCDMLEPPTLVFRGESVMVEIPIGNAAVRLEGIALDNGALGDEIRVRNPDSDAIITAIVTGPSRAEINIF